MKGTWRTVTVPVRYVEASHVVGDITVEVQQRRARVRHHLGYPAYRVRVFVHQSTVTEQKFMMSA